MSLVDWILTIVVGLVVLVLGIWLGGKIGADKFRRTLK